MSGASGVSRTCEDYRELLSAEVDGLASAEEAREVALHLARCGACAQARADYVAVGAALSAADERAPGPRPEVWDGIEAHSTAALRRRTGSREDRAHAPAHRPARRMLLAAAFAVGLGIAFGLGRFTSPHGAPTLPAGGASPDSIAAAPSREAEEAAIAIIADALFAGERGAANDLNARIRAVEPAGTRGRAARDERSY